MRVNSSAPRALCEQLVAGKHDVERVGINASPRGQLRKRRRRSRVRTVVGGSVGLARSTGVRGSNGRGAPLLGQMRADAREPGGADVRGKFKVEGGGCRGTQRPCAQGSGTVLWVGHGWGCQLCTQWSGLSSLTHCDMTQISVVNDHSFM